MKIILSKFGGRQALCDAINGDGHYVARSTVDFWFHKTPPEIPDKWHRIIKEASDKRGLEVEWSDFQ